LNVKKKHQQLTLTTSETQSKINSLTEQWTTSTEKWDSEINSLKAQVAATMEAGDATQMELHKQLQESTANRDAVLEELKKIKSLLQKEKEEMEKLNKKLLKQEAKARKVKEGLEEIMKNEQAALNRSIDEFRKHLLIHLQDMNTWRPILEDHREFDWKTQAKVPTNESIAGKPFNEQVLKLSGAVKADLKPMRDLLGVYEQETAELVSVTVGKRKKRNKKYAWEQEFPKDLAAPEKPKTEAPDSARKRAGAGNPKDKR